MTARIDKKHTAIRTEIKENARLLMAELGTAGVSIRGIARKMEITAPAIYRYYASLDDLITDLILEDFTHLAEALETANISDQDQPANRRLVSVLVAYRRWAVEHPLDFQLIYGNPIPGYIAPADLTVPAVMRGFSVIVQLMAEALQNGSLVPAPRYRAVPEEFEAAMEPTTHFEGFQVPVLAIYLATIGWPMIHGMIMLELFEHLQPVVGNVELFYRIQVENLLGDLGMKF